MLNCKLQRKKYEYNLAWQSTPQYALSVLLTIDGKLCFYRI